MGIVETCWITMSDVCLYIKPFQTINLNENVSHIHLHQEIEISCFSFSVAKFSSDRKRFLKIFLSLNIFTADLNTGPRFSVTRGLFLSPISFFSKLFLPLGSWHKALLILDIRCTWLPLLCALCPRKFINRSLSLIINWSRFFHSSLP